jgi:hypothetical protein
MPTNERSSSVMRSAAAVAIIALALGSGVAAADDAANDAATTDGTADAEVTSESIETRIAMVPIDPDQFAGSEPAIDGLPPLAVLRIAAAGFDPHVSGAVEQCEITVGIRCSNPIPVRFDDGGRAEFQYLLRQPTPAACRASSARCVVRLRAEGKSAVTRIVFVDSFPEPGRIVVEPVGDLQLGDRVNVRVTGFPRGIQVSPVLCAPPFRSGVGGCSTPQNRMTIGADGTAETFFTIPLGRVGASSLPCDRRHRCGISVVGRASDPGAAVVLISFADPPGAAYDAGRVYSGIGAAFLLMLVAWWLVRRTDWSPVGEVAAPEIDNAEYADLDAIVAELDAAEAAEAAVG